MYSIPIQITELLNQSHSVVTLLFKEPDKFVSFCLNINYEGIINNLQHIENWEEG